MEILAVVVKPTDGTKREDEKMGCDLTEREREVMHWVAGGKTNPEIASILEISAFTVKNHMQRVFKKLEVTNRAQAVSKIMPLVSHAQN